MRNVDIEIYIKDLKSFFESNPNTLYQIISKDRENDFYDMVRKFSEENLAKGREVILTEEQFFEISRKLSLKVFEITPFGLICNN